MLNFSRHALFVLLCMLCITVDAPSQVQARLPSEVCKNVGTMRQTDFSDNAYAVYIDVEQDVQSYITMELERIEKSGVAYSGSELYYLAYLYSEVARSDKAVKHLEKLLDQPMDGDKELGIKARTLLTENIIRIGDLKRAEMQLTILEAAGVPYLDLLFFEISKGYAAKRNESKALDFARKALSRMNPELAGFFLDPLITQFIAYDLNGAALKILEGVGSEDPETKVFLEKRRKQIAMVGRPVRDLSVEGMKWINGKPAGEGALGSQGKAVLIYFWASWCKPCLTFYDIAHNLVEKYGDQQLDIVGVTRLYGYVQGYESEKNQSLERKREIALLGEYCSKLDMPFPSVIDEKDRIGTAVHLDELPHLLLLDAKGTVRFFRSGGIVEHALLEKAIQSALKGEN